MCSRRPSRKEGERMAAPFYRFVKQAPGRKWFSDASYS